MGLHLHFKMMYVHRYKLAFVDEAVWKVLAAKMSSTLEVDPAERSEEQQLIMERLLILVRNILQVSLIFA